MDSKPSVPRCTQITGEKDREQARVNREWETAKERNQNLACAKNRGLSESKKRFSRQIEHIYRLNIQRRREDWSF